eukprot:scaffold2572_cov391-Prasinococcus_capsulatus_cf.AAC.6
MPGKAFLNLLVPSRPGFPWLEPTLLPRVTASDGSPRPSARQSKGTPGKKSRSPTRTVAPGALQREYLYSAFGRPARPGTTRRCSGIDRTPCDRPPAAAATAPATAAARAFPLCRESAGARPRNSIPARGRSDVTAAQLSRWSSCANPGAVAESPNPVIGGPGEALARTRAGRAPASDPSLRECTQLWSAGPW